MKVYVDTHAADSEGRRPGSPTTDEVAAHCRCWPRDPRRPRCRRVLQRGHNRRSGGLVTVELFDGEPQAVEEGPVALVRHIQETIEGGDFDVCLARSVIAEVAESVWG